MSTRLLLSFLIICTVSASEPPVEQAMEATGLSAGLAVTMGSDAAIDRRILEARPGWLLLSLPGDSTAADNRRAELAGSDQGRATVHPLLSPSVPVFTRAAALLVVDADTLGDRAPDDQTIRTALRPYGTAFIKRNGTWTSITAPWPDSIADYPHWLGGADFSAQVPDQEIGQARSLRWQSARNEETGNTVIMANGILVSQMKVQIGWKTNLAPSAFDAFTGLRLWQRPLLRVFGKYAMVMDDKRVVLPYFEMKPKEHPQLAKERMQEMIAENTFKPVALDARTGETLLVYDEAPTMPMMDRNTSASNLTLNLVDGKLIVKVGGKIGVLDADSGKRLWQVEHKGKVLFPAVADGLLVVAQGTGLAHSRAHGHQYDADVTGFHTIIGYDLESGDERWRWQPDEVEHGNKVRLTMLNQNDGSVWLDYDVKIKRSQWFLLRIDPKTGNTIWKTKHKELGPTDQFARAFVFDEVVFLSRGAQDGYRFDVETGKQIGGKWFTMQGGCHAPRASAAHMFHSGVSVTGNGTEHDLHWAHMIAGRCHLGAFPGHGMLVAADSGCNCDPFIRGLAAYGSESAPEILETVTVTGSGSPAAEVSGDQWRSAFRDAKRSAWSTQPLAEELSISWTSKLGKGSVDGPLSIRRFDITAGPGGLPTIAGDISVVTRPHDHEVVGMSVSDGSTRWRHRAMGRLDGAVTLAGGMAIFGSAAGWIEAISLTDGQLVWKTLVAPDSRFRVRSGQIESSHPFVSSVAVIGDTVYASSGMHTHVDGGLHFVALDLASGTLKDRTIYDGSPPAMDLHEQSGPHDALKINPDFGVERSKKGKTWQTMMGTYPSTAYSLAYQEQQNGPLVMTPDGWLGLGTLAYDPTGKSIKLGGIDLHFVSTGHQGHLHKNEARWPQQVRVGLLSRIESSGKGHEKALLAGIMGRAFAYQGDDIIVIESASSGGWSADRSRVSAYSWRETPTHLTSNERGNVREAVSAEVLWADKPRRKPKSSPRALPSAATAC